MVSYTFWLVLALNPCSDGLGDSGRGKGAIPRELRALQDWWDQQLHFPKYIPPARQIVRLVAVRDW